MSPLFRRSTNPEASDSQPGPIARQMPTHPHPPPRPQQHTTPSSASIRGPPSPASTHRSILHADTSPNSSRTVKQFDEQTGLDVRLANASRRGSSSSSPIMRRESSEPPSPRSGHASLRDDKSIDGHAKCGEASQRTRSRTPELQPRSHHSRRDKQTSPVATRLGAERPVMAAPQTKQDTTSQLYPGVVIGNFSSNGANVLGFDGSMDDIVDSSASRRAGERQGSASGQAGANIAPWLMDDSVPSSPAAAQNVDPFSSTREPSRKQAGQPLSHYASQPALSSSRSKSKAQVDPVPSRNGSQPSLSPASGPYMGSDSSNQSRTCLGSSESVQTLGTTQKGKRSPNEDHVTPLPGGGRHASVAGSRMARYGSTASNISGTGSIGSEKKKSGFLGGLLKRKTGQSVSQHHNLPADFHPTDAYHRGSTSGSAGSKISTSTSYGSLSNKPSPTGRQSPKRSGFRQTSFVSEGAISPLHELREHEFTLDMNLDDMSGIVDTTKTAVPSASGTTLPSLPQGQSDQTTSSTLESTSGSAFFAEGVKQSSFATTMSSSSGSEARGSADITQTPGRSVVSSAHRQSGDPFVRKNPFQSDSPTGSIDGKLTTPPSPHTLSLSPKHAMAPSTQPRRPSQLRNMKISSFDSDASSEAPSSGLQPLAPAWATEGSPSATMFNDPFGSAKPAGEGASEGVSPSQPSHPSISLGRPLVEGQAPPIASAAVWAAPESWGVEGDEMPDEATSSEEDDWAQAEDSPSVPVSDKTGGLLQPSASASSHKPPPFGHKSLRDSTSTATSRPGTSARRKKGARPSTASRPGTAGRPGTSGSTHGSTLPHFIRIYRGDGSYSIMAFPVNATTSEVISALSADSSKKVTANMRLYLRERGQDRQLMSSEKPLAIQDRRLRQAGYTEAENVEEIGKNDLFTLCKFIFQTPNLPVMNPEEESSYDSFEFIDFSNRDLLTIPIFLHLHAHNIIILNISRNPMSDIPLDFIQACTNLKELRMSYMALKRVPTSICASTTLSRLDFSCNRIADLETVPLHEITTLLSLKVQNNKLTSIPSYFSQMKALKYLNISNNKFETFPDVVSSMSNLVDLDVSFNTIAELPSQMSNLKSLERLAAFGNELTTFPESFSTLANLRVLDVRRNKLTNLNSVYALPNLTTLQADYNNLVTLDAQLGVKVRQFSVPHNSITRFTLAPLPNMKAVTYSLTHLNLSHGKISTLDEDSFSGLINLIDLKLDHNQFTRLPSTLARLTNLEIISCTDNMLETLPKGMGRLQKLRILNFHNNNLKELPYELWLCPALESMNVSSNLIKGAPSLPGDAEVLETLGEEGLAKWQEVTDSAGLHFKPALERLYFADNQLTDDFLYDLTHLSNLKILNLSFNDIFEIPPSTISKMVNLEALYLSGNKLTSLPSEDLEKLTKLKILHLNGNKLQTLPSELGALVSLQHLDVGNNVLKYNIANWPYDWNWNWNTALKYLNLSGNKRLEIKPTSAQDLSHAGSFRKELSDFNALTQLRILGLMDVNIRIPSLPDESDEKRVRTSFSEINSMAYGISDMLGSVEHLAMFDMVVPNFRGKENECVFGMFGRHAPSTPAGTIPKFLQESFTTILNAQIEKLNSGEDITQALRRTFLHAQRATFEHLLTIPHGSRKQSVTSLSSVDSMFRNWSPNPTSSFRTGSSGAVVYLVDKTLHVGNVGDCLVVLSRKGEAELLSKYHDPTDRDETARIRRAEAWVSTKGYINDDKDIDISRAVGYWQNFPAVNPDPEIRTRQLAESDEFVIIGNHALWSCCSYQTAVDIARTERDDPMIAAQKLRDFAISYGAEGSVMVMVVNVSDLFYGGRVRRPRGNASSSAPAADVDGDAHVGRDKRIRRRYEEVGDRTLNRLQQEIEPPQGQVAIVFTDIVNSTHLWETNPGMPTAIKMHHNLMRRQLRLDGGYEVKTEGDSFMVSFQTVTAALLWAFNCQIGLLQAEWPRELLDAQDGKICYDSEGNLIQRGLRVRMGVHWGAPQCERDPITRRMDYYGPMVNRAARINASADGGQLMASQDVINEIQALREYLDTLDEDGLSGMPPEMKRELAELRTIGFEVKDMGERKLKGLEVPERLHLLYPKSLSGRFEVSDNLRANVEVANSRALAGPRTIDHEQVREIARVVVRLERLCSASHAIQAAPPPVPSSPTMPLSPTTPGMEATPSKRSTRGVKLPPPIYLKPGIREDMNDEELTIVLESLATRLENSLSTLFLKQLGGFSSVLASLEQATQIDAQLLLHALALMNGAMGQ